jgi:hypothetical protein
MINALGMGGSQDRSIVLAWKKLPMMGAVKITHFELAIGHDELDEYGRSPAKSVKAEMLGGDPPDSGVTDLGWAMDNAGMPYKLWYDPSNTDNTDENTENNVATLIDSTHNMYDDVPYENTVPLDHAMLTGQSAGHDDTGQTTTTAVNNTNDDGHRHVWEVELEKATKGLDSDGKSMGFAIGIQPLAGAGMQGGLNIGSLTYNFGYERMRDGYPEGPGKIYGPTTQERVTLLNVPAIKGDHDYTVHGVRLDPMKWLGLGFNFATYKAKAEGSATATNKLNEFRAAAVIWLWGPKNGALSGSKSEGGISVSPLYTVAKAKRLDGKVANAKVKNNGLAVVYNVPGGWFQIHGVWDSLGCTGSCPGNNIADVADTGKNSFNVFTLIAEYKF